MDFTDIFVRIIEGAKGMTWRGVIVVTVLCVTWIIHVWIKAFHSNQEKQFILQATPEQRIARSGANLKPIAPPPEPPSPMLPLAALVFMSASLLVPSEWISAHSRRSRVLCDSDADCATGQHCINSLCAAPVSGPRQDRPGDEFAGSAVLPLVDYEPDMRSRSLPVYSIGAR